MKKLLILLLALLLTGCTALPKQHSRTFFAMDTVMQITVNGGDEALLTEAVNAVADLEQKLSVTDENSEIYRLNTSGSGDLSPETAELLAAALSLCDRSGGLLDVTVYPVLKSWGFTGDTYRIPEETEIKALLEQVDYRRVALNDRHVTLPEGVMVDLGSVGKGYTGDMLSSFLRDLGITSACINLGGNVQTIGAKPDGSCWRVGVQDPDSSNSVCAVELIDRAAVTSGMYQRYFTGEDGEIYGHIIDPRTGHPADSDLRSVTVIGPSGTVCDGLSTTLFIAGFENSVRFWRDSGDFEAVFILSDGSVAITEGLENSFTLLQTQRELLIIRRSTN